MYILVFTLAWIMLAAVVMQALKMTRKTSPTEHEHDTTSHSCDCCTQSCTCGYPEPYTQCSRLGYYGKPVDFRHTPVDFKPCHVPTNMPIKIYDILD